MNILLAGILLVLTLGLGGEAAAEPAVVAAEQKIPYKRADESSAGIALRVAGALVITILAGIGVVYGMKRLLPSIYRPMVAGGTRIQVLEVRRLTAKTILFLVEVDGTRLLLAQSGEGMSLLQQVSGRGGGAAHDDRLV